MHKLIIIVFIFIEVNIYVYVYVYVYMHKYYYVWFVVKASGDALDPIVFIDEENKRGPRGLKNQIMWFLKVFNRLVCYV